MANKDGEFKAQFKGEYFWDEYINIDNTKNEGSIIKKVDKETVVALSYNEVAKSVQSSKEGAEIGLSAGGVFDVISVEAKANLSTTVKSEYETLTDSKIDKTTRTKNTDTIEIGGKSSLKLYRLAFRAPGVSYTTDTISTNTNSVPDVPIEVKGRLVPVLKDIEVVYTEDFISCPDDLIEEVTGWTSNPNWGWNTNLAQMAELGYASDELAYSYVWLRPIWTWDLKEGVTGIQVAVQHEKNDKFQDLAKGTGGDYRYLKMIKDPQSKQRITDIAIFTPNRDSTEKLPKGYEFYANINEGRTPQVVTVGKEEFTAYFGNCFLVWNEREVQ